MDPLSDVLALMKVRNFAARQFEAGPAWSIRFGSSGGVKLIALIAGGGWLALDGAEEPLQIFAGDCLLLASSKAYQVASDLSLPPTDGTELLTGLYSGDTARFSDGTGCIGIAGYFDIAEEHTALLSYVLPPVIHIKNEVDRQDIRWTLDRMRREFNQHLPGASLVAQQLATMVLVQVLRTHLTSNHRANAGWLFALADKRIGLSLTAIHEHPAQRWSLETLARHAGMSRTGFAVRFKETVGVAPMTYVTNWRMTLAKDRMRYSSDAFGAIAAQVGYESETAFSTAFKRVVGCSPRQYVKLRSDKLSR